MVRQYHQAASPLQRRVYLLRRFDKVRADGPGSATRVRRMAVPSARSVPRAAPAGPASR